MKLTINTLLAWLDDTLTLEDADDLGRQIEGSNAVPLIGRILRLLHDQDADPRGQGLGFDPNLITDYLDNNLAPEAVLEFETRCLSSDALLAEVAGVHRLLALLGTKMSPSAEAQRRFYGLAERTGPAAR